MKTARKTARFDFGSFGILLRIRWRSSFDNAPHSAASLCREFSSDLVAPRVLEDRNLEDQASISLATSVSVTFSSVVPVVE